MKRRLTKKYGKYGRPYCFNCKEEVRFDNDIVRQMLYKMGDLEDLEEEIGCPLEVYAKLVYDAPIYDKNGYKGFVNAVKKYEVSGYGQRYIIDVIYFSEEEGRKDVVRGFPLEDYKKTWWLKEDKSE